MNVATALNEKYVPYTYVMLYSLFKNNIDAEIYVYLLNSELTPNSIDVFSSLAGTYNCHIIDIKINPDDFPEKMPRNEQWTIEACFRLMMMEIMPIDIDRILYLDGDIIVNGSLQELYLSDFSGNQLIASLDMGMNTQPNELYYSLRPEIMHKYVNKDTYFCSGMLLYNLDALRGKIGFDDYIKLAEDLEYNLLAPDQDLLNITHYGQIKYVDFMQYNFFARVGSNIGYDYKYALNNPIIIHFTGFKPWEGDYFHYDIEKIWWDYANCTPFANLLKDQFIRSSMDGHLVSDYTQDLLHQIEALKTTLNSSIDAFNRLKNIINA